MSLLMCLASNEFVLCICCNKVLIDAGDCNVQIPLPECMPQTHSYSAAGRCFCLRGI